MYYFGCGWNPRSFLLTLLIQHLIHTSISASSCSFICSIARKHFSPVSDTFNISSLPLFLSTSLQGFSPTWTTEFPGRGRRSSRRWWRDCRGLSTEVMTLQVRWLLPARWMSGQGVLLVTDTTQRAEQRVCFMCFLAARSPRCSFSRSGLFERRFKANTWVFWDWCFFPPRT